MKRGEGKVIVCATKMLLGLFVGKYTSAISVMVSGLLHIS